jgi:hypothetical protein
MDGVADVNAVLGRVGYSVALTKRLSHTPTFSKHLETVAKPTRTTAMKIDG